MLASEDIPLSDTAVRLVALLGDGAAASQDATTALTGE